MIWKCTHNTGTIVHAQKKVEIIYLSVDHIYHSDVYFILSLMIYALRFVSIQNKF